MAGQGEGRVRRQLASTFNGAVAMARPTSISTPVKTTIEVLQPEQGKIGGSLACVAGDSGSAASNIGCGNNTFSTDPTSGFLRVSDTHNPRILQLGAKFIF